MSRKNEENLLTSNCVTGERAIGNVPTNVRTRIYFWNAWKPIRSSAEKPGGLQTDVGEGGVYGKNR